MLYITSILKRSKISGHTSRHAWPPVWILITLWNMAMGDITVRTLAQMPISILRACESVCQRRDRSGSHMA
ncbi:hypothetical protein DPMN_030735 [Dreissena polymorpha]|uniref:Uncharacterized protein n=1 Tax=Dreissena polymorpha TaxID=45954 RepID=A0A9D4M0X3_DREPO|nr:hypothetical protein DPMN_030735 [Dreissena polymorpha]